MLSPWPRSGGSFSWERRTDLCSPPDFVPGQTEHQLPRVECSGAQDYDDDRHHPVEEASRPSQYGRSDQDQPDAAGEGEDEGREDPPRYGLQSPTGCQLADNGPAVEDRLQQIQHAEDE